MSSNQPLILGGIHLPTDLSPLERAKLKLYSYIVIYVLVNAFLSVLALLNQGKVLTWNDVVGSLIGGGFLALFSVLKKYYSATGDVPMSTVVQLAQNEYAAKGLPQAPKLSANEQALQQAVSNALPLQVSSSGVSSPPVQNSATPAQVSFQVSQPNPVSNQATSAQSIQQAVQAPVDNHPSLDNVSLSNTLPTIQAIAK